jgi:hypothetical protein
LNILPITSISIFQSKMAASTSTSTASISCHDVFISHRGPDVKKGFASHLYRRLLSYGLRVFLDQPELQRGDYFTHQIHDAIRSASVHVAIFSSGYADSNWCLDELVQMLDSKTPIIPVFYGVKPAELRWTLGKKKSDAEALNELEKKTVSDPQTDKEKKRSYAEALEELEKKTDYDPQTGKKKLRYDSSTIENWRNALSRVAEISGIELEACNG